MTSRTWAKHGIALCSIALVAFLINGASYFISGIPATYQLSSDATVHEVVWQEDSHSYTGNLAADTMFQNYNGQSSGMIAANQAFASMADVLHIPLLDFSVIISIISLAIFLSGVYMLVYCTTRKYLLALVIALVSTVPVISLGLSSWSFMIGGYVPKELSLGIAVWITVLYVTGIAEESKRKISASFLLLGLAANYYPPLFLHYALVLICAEVVRARSIRIEHIVYGLLLLIASPVALYDVFIHTTKLSPPDKSLILEHYTGTLHSLSYLFLHYLRKQYIYGVLVGISWFVYTRVIKKTYSPVLMFWFAVWWVSLLLSLVGVGIELWAPLYEKYLLSRISVWFYLASMIIIGFSVYEIYFTKLSRSLGHKVFFACALGAVLLAQTSILNVFTGIKENKRDSADYLNYIQAVQQVRALVPAQTLVLANPDGEANSIRTYGGVGTYVSRKDGNVILFDGDAARAWFARYSEAQSVFKTKDFSQIRAYAIAHQLPYYFFDAKDIKVGSDQLKKYTIEQVGAYGLVKLY
jgi:hypothetical protein